MNKDNQNKQKGRRRRTSPNPGETMPSLFERSRQAPPAVAGQSQPRQGANQGRQNQTGGQGQQRQTGAQGQQRQSGGGARRRGDPRPTVAAPRAPQAVLKKSAAVKRDEGSVVRIISLGGLNEVGKNVTAIECGDDIIVVDCGIAFPDDSMPGVDLVLPDFTYLVKNADRLRGVVITHGHEDHTGGIPYLLKQLSAPIYGTRLTCGLINNKLEEHKLAATSQLYQVEYGDVLTLGCMKVEIIRSNHSIPDACALAIDTPAGRIVFTGDFKIDATPIDGEMIDLARFGELGKDGVLALLSDSTNAERPGFTKSERVVGATLDRLFATTDKRIIVTTFASNIHRVKQIIDAAAKYNRKVAVSGRSMVNNVEAAIALGVIKVDESRIIDVTEIKNYQPNQLVVVTTGSQGEPMSALYRMAFADHRNIEIGPTDLVIISASPIPGNEKTVSKVKNELLKRGAEVITSKTEEVHVSGHASQEEHKLIIGLTKPKFFVPVHGEYSHLRAHADTARMMGIAPEHIIISDIGKVIELTADSCRLAGTVPSGKVFIDGLGVGDVGSIVLRDRKHLAEDGLIVAVASIDMSTGEILSGPEVVSRGFVYVREAEDMMEAARTVLRGALERELMAGTREWNTLKSAMKDSLSNYIYKETKRNPMILPVLIRG